MTGTHGFQLDGDLFTVSDVGAEVDVAERAGANLLAEPVFVGDAYLSTRGIGGSRAVVVGCHGRERENGSIGTSRAVVGD